MAIKDYRLENLPRSTQAAVFTLIIGCLAFAFYWYFLKDLMKEQRRLEEETARLERSVAQGNAVEKRLREFKLELEQLEHRLAVLQTLLPAQKETPSVLRSVQEMAASSNLKITKFTPQPVVPRAFYADWPIALEVEGNYNALGSFFEKVSRADRLIDVGSISIKGIEDSTDASRTLLASCTATTYVFREDQVTLPEEEQTKTGKKGKKR
jgi:type IV pilus assembly protein PilO